MYQILYTRIYKYIYIQASCKRLSWPEDHFRPSTAVPQAMASISQTYHKLHKSKPSPARWTRGTLSVVIVADLGREWIPGQPGYMISG